MNFTIHKISGQRIAELDGNDQIIRSVDDAVDLLGNASHQDAQKVIVFQSQLHPDFFDLRTGIAGEILQKFSNYRMQLAIVGDFGNISSKSLRDFIRESNRQRRILFTGTRDEAVQQLSKENS